MSCIKTRPFTMTYTFVCNAVSKKIIAQRFNAISQIQKIPAIHLKFSEDTHVRTPAKPTVFSWIWSDWTPPSEFWEIRPCPWNQRPLRLLLWCFRPDTWRRRNQAIWKTRLHFRVADRAIWTSIRVHRRHRHHILLHMLLCNQTNRQLIW